MVRFFRVYKTYPGGIKALQDVTFSVAKGEFVFVTGPSGAGKTTLLKLIVLAEHPDRGEILLDGLNITRLPPSKVPYLRRKVGFVFQDFKLLKDRTVFENVALPLEVMGYSPRRLQKRIHQVVRLVGLEESHLDQLPQRLSGGEQQRVAIARALVNNPPLLIADEPTGNLDPDLTIEIMELFQKTNRLGTTVIVATHDPSLVARYGHRNIPLRRGRVVQG